MAVHRLVYRTGLLAILVAVTLFITKDLGLRLRNEITAIHNNGRNSSFIQAPQRNISRDWRCANDHRVSYLKKMCQERQQSIPYHHARVVVDQKHNLLYCEVSKAGCTSVKGVWIQANRQPNGRKTMNASELSVHGETAHSGRHLGQAGIKLHKINNWGRQFEKTIKFITVRHPYDRLVSAYYNLRFWKPGRGDALPYVTGHFKQRFKNSTHGDLKQLTFEQFLSVVTDKSIRIYQDRHWKPYTESCYVCHVEYDYIMKTETLYRDLEQIMGYLGHPGLKLLDIQMNAYKRDTDSARNETIGGNQQPVGWSKHLPEFGTLSSEIRQAVAKRYANDMMLFGYHFDEETNMASCAYDSVKLEDGFSCC